MECAAKEKPKSQSITEEDTSFKRGNWNKQVEFTLSCIGYAVGLGNIWRFPYLCMRNGGGAFLIPYFTFLFLCGLPLYFLELTLGQFSNLGPVTVWKMCPLFKGIGWGMVVVSTVLALYYNILIAWSLYYLGMSFASDVPWRTCDNEWNTPQCYIRTRDSNSSQTNETENVNVTSAYEAIGKRYTPTEEFWNNKVLDMSSGIEDLGGIKWELLVCLIVAWLITFLCLYKGVKSLGKVVYITATFPYLFLTILLIRGVTLPGSLEGIKFYIIPDWTKLADFNVWMEACLQIFYSLGPAWGGLVTMASYNKFDNNHLRDSVVVCLICSGTSFYAGFVIFSVVGYMAYNTGLPVDEVISQGPGLAFIAYPEAISAMPLSPLWAILFFLMLICTGVDGQFGMVETIVSGLVDEYPGLLRKRKMWFTLFVCATLCLLGLPFATRGGIYVFQIVDWYGSAFSATVIGFSECVVLAWIYGVRRLYFDLSLMMKTTPSYWWAACWLVITPIITLTIIIVNCFSMSPPTQGDYHYPAWAIGIGWCIALCSLVPIPLIIFIRLVEARGPVLQRLRTLLRPHPDFGPAKESLRAMYRYEASQYHLSFSRRVNSNIYMPNPQALNSNYEKTKIEEPDV